MRSAFVPLLICGWLLACIAWAQPLTLATFEYPPYMTNQNGHPEGRMVSLLDEVFSRMQVTVTYEFLPWARALNDVQYGNVDGLFTIKKTASREQWLMFPMSMLVRQDYHFFALKGSDFAFNGNLRAIERFTIGVVHKTSYGHIFDNAVQNRTLTHLDFANSHQQSFKKLLGHRVDAVICSKQVGLEIIQRLNAEDQIEVNGPSVNREGSYLVFTRQRDFTALAKQFDQTMNAVILDGTYARIMQQSQP